MKINTPDKIVATVFTAVFLFCWFFMAELAPVLQAPMLYAVICLFLNKHQIKGITGIKFGAGLFCGILSTFGYSSFLMGGVYWSTFLAGNTLFLWFMVRFSAYGYYYGYHTFGNPTRQ